MLAEQDLDLLQAYLDDTVPPEQVNGIEARLKTDVQLAEAAGGQPGGLFVSVENLSINAAILPTELRGKLGDGLRKAA